MKYFICTIIAIVSATVIAGFFIVGSPAEERARRLDEQRIQHLQFLQSEIVSYWINKSKLPVNLAALEDNIRGITIPKDPDPESGGEYQYTVKGPLSFSLCATFARPSLDYEITTGKPRVAEPFGYDIQQNWQHEAGLTCFDRTIDPEIYKPTKIR